MKMFLNAEFNPKITEPLDPSEEAVLFQEATENNSSSLKQSKTKKVKDLADLKTASQISAIMFEGMDNNALEDERMGAFLDVDDDFNPSTTKNVRFRLEQVSEDEEDLQYRIGDLDNADDDLELQLAVKSCLSVYGNKVIFPKTSGESNINNSEPSDTKYNNFIYF